MITLRCKQVRDFISRAQLDYLEGSVIERVCLSTQAFSCLNELLEAREFLNQLIRRARAEEKIGGEEFVKAQIKR